MAKLDRIVSVGLWAAAVCLGGYLAGRGYRALQEYPIPFGRNVLEQAYSAVAETAFAWHLPGCFYEEEENTVLTAGIWENVKEHFPLFTYLEHQKEEETVVEDESTCHEIMEKSGQTIADRILSENQEEAVEQENQAVREDADAEDGQEESSEEPPEESPEESPEQEGVQEETKEMPAWTTAVETSPLLDLSMEQLSDFNYLLNNFFVVDPNTTIDSSQMNASQLLEDPLTLTKDPSVPQILIYHTHSQEGFVDSREGDESTTVIGVGDYLESILRDVFGYQVIHLRNTFDVVDGQIDRSAAYNYAQPVVQQVLDENPSIEVVIDLHRDGVPDDKHLVTEINGKPTAQVMYFNGLSYTVTNGALDSLPNPYIADNLAFSFQLSYQAARYYPHFTRCIYLKGYRYNLHMRPRSILLEVGAQTNTVEEAMNAMEPFSVILDKVLKGE